VLNPLSPKDPRRSSQSLSDILLRYVVRPTRGLLETGHDSAGMLDYVAFGLRLGARGTVNLFARFMRAVIACYAIWREHASDSARRIRQQHERKMADLAAALDLKLESLRALASLQHPPVTQSFGYLALAVMLDRILLSVVAVSAAVLALFVTRPWPHGVVAAVLICAALASASALLSRLRHHIDPSSELRERANRVARLFPAAFVVMGHTHLPEMRAAESGEAVYVNLGAWAEGDEGGGEGGASRTHLVVHAADDGRSTAELRVWDSVAGPRPFVSVRESA
jgi:hypothetical protein